MTGRIETPSEGTDSGAIAPRIAVIVPAYGVAHLVGDALASLLAQTFEDWECVVIDDGAPDDVAGAVAPFLDDPRIRFMATENQGVSRARNTAIRQTRAPYIALLDGDDRLRPRYLERMVETLERDDGARIVTCNARLFGAVRWSSNVVDCKQGTGDGVHGSFSDVLDRSFNVYIGSSFRRADFDRIGGFDPDLAHSEDFDFWVRLMTLGGHATYINDILGDYRIRRGSASSDTPRMYRGMIRVYSKLLDENPGLPETDLVRRLIADNESHLRIQEMIDEVLNGDRYAGIEKLRRDEVLQQSRLWRSSFVLWRVAPGLARPMLAWRKQVHARGTTIVSLVVSMLLYVLAVETN